MKLNKIYSILNCKNGKAKIVPNHDISIVVLIGFIIMFFLVIIVTLVLFAADNLKNESYRELEKQLKIEEKSLLEWRLEYDYKTR